MFIVDLSTHRRPAGVGKTGCRGGRVGGSWGTTALEISCRESVRKCYTSLEEALERVRESIIKS